jgi:hypothetical protein
VYQPLVLVYQLLVLVYQPLVLVYESLIFWKGTLSKGSKKAARRNLLAALI